MNKKKIIYVTGTRADYGLMRELLKKLDQAEEFDLSLCITGMHLSSLYGNTIDEINADGFKICGVIPVEVDIATKESMAMSIGQEILGMTEIFKCEQPNFILLLGDRGEMLAAAIVAAHLNIPIVHLHGGERSGTVDEMVRHAISKLSHYHFVSTEASGQRLIKMGEKENTVFVVGAPGLDEINNHQVVSKETFCQKFKFIEQKKIALLVYHPVVQEYSELEQQFNNVIQASLSFDLQLICLEPNSDAGGHIIRSVLKKYSSHIDLRIFKHLYRREYIDCLAHADIMLGNSSSGIIEAASFNLVVVNIGSRQNLRERGDNIIDVSTDLESISLGLSKALALPLKKYTNCYGDGLSSERCYHLLRNINIDNKILNKCNAY